jgi:nitroreductase
MTISNDYWMGRRTIRRYKSTPINRDLLNDLLLKASHAPTTGNMQLYSVIVTCDDAGKKALAPTHFNQPQVVGAAAVLTFCADFNRLSKWCEYRKAEPCYDNLQSFVAAAIDTIAFAQQFNTLAEGSGLGCCWLGTTTYNAQQIADVLHLPKLVVPIITLTVGYPDEDGVETGRLPLSAIVHEEHYADYTPECIDAVYAEKEARSDSKMFVEENQKETLAQVFTDVRYPRANNEFFSNAFREFLCGTGFLSE